MGVEVPLVLPGFTGSPALDDHHDGDDSIQDVTGLYPQILQDLQQAERVLVTSHMRPDGDAVGSLLGIGLALQETGKNVQMVLEDGVPGAFKSLPGNQLITREPSEPVDYIIVVDCSDVERAGDVLTHMRKPDLNIDHHVTNEKFARINLVDTRAVATAAILTEHLPKIGCKISTNVASVLLTGIISDTIGFRTNNMTPEALRLAASLMEAGANLPDLYQKALLHRSYNATRYWGAGLARLQRDNGLVWTSLTLSDRQLAHYPGNDDADLVNILSSIDEAEVAVIFIEQKDARVKVSWRSQLRYDVSQVALQFGGGGHPAASGAEIPGDLRTVQAEVLNATRLLMDKEQNNHEKVVQDRSVGG